MRHGNNGYPVSLPSERSRRASTENAFGLIVALNDGILATPPGVGVDGTMMVVGSLILLDRALGLELDEER